MFSSWKDPPGFPHFPNFPHFHQQLHLQLLWQYWWRWWEGGRTAGNRTETRTHTLPRWLPPNCKKEIKFFVFEKVNLKQKLSQKAEGLQDQLHYDNMCDTLKQFSDYVSTLSLVLLLLVYISKHLPVHLLLLIYFVLNVFLFIKKLLVLLIKGCFP